MATSKLLVLTIVSKFAQIIADFITGLPGFTAVKVDGEKLSFSVNRVERANGPFDGGFTEADFQLLRVGVALLAIADQSSSVNIKPNKGWSGDGEKDWKRLSGHIRSIVKSGHKQLKNNRSMGPNSTVVQHLLSTVVRNGVPMNSAASVDTKSIEIDF